MNFSLANMNATAGYLDYNTPNVFNKYRITYSYSAIMMYLVPLIICCIGVPLNGIVIWLLGFQIKRNSFTVLILNLAIADFGFLISMTIICFQSFIHVTESYILLQIHSLLFIIMYISGLFLLTAISIDRCVAVLFPIWHRCSRPKYLSSAVCVFLWICSFFLGGINKIIQSLFVYTAIRDVHLVVTAVVCLPLITISAMILFIKICLKSKQIKRRRLLMMILITLLCFLILTLPLYIYVFSTHFFKKEEFFDIVKLNFYLCPSSSLNSSINPVIYFLVGRKKRGRTKESIKVVFQRVFGEVEGPETK